MQAFRPNTLGGILAVVVLAVGASNAWAGAGLSSFGVTPSPPSSSPPATPLGLPVSTKTTLVIPVGSEFCGIDSIFANGFESLVFTPATQLPGGGVSPGLTQDIIGSGTLTVSITTSGTTSDAYMDVVGTFVGPVNTGISVNGVAGYTANGQFVVPNVPLTAGSNALTATATTLPGATATAPGSITQSGSATPITVVPERPVGFAPFAESFKYLIGTLPGNASISSVTINFKGSGGNDYSGSLAAAPTSYTYQQAGLYTAQFQFTDSNSVVYTIKRSVLIQDITVQRGMLCDVYGYLRDRLNAQDASGAANAFQPAERTTYLNFFNTLGTNMPTAAGQLGVIVNGLVGVGYGDFLLVQDNSDQTRSGYPLRMTQSGDGVWRISEM
jgi:hypothetical protein